MTTVNRAAVDELRALNEELSNALDSDDDEDIRDAAEKLTQALRIALGPSEAEAPPEQPPPQSEQPGTA